MHECTYIVYTHHNNLLHNLKNIIKNCLLNSCKIVQLQTCNSHQCEMQQLYYFLYTQNNYTYKHEIHAHTGTKVHYVMHSFIVLVYTYCIIYTYIHVLLSRYIRRIIYIQIHTILCRIPAGVRFQVSCQPVTTGRVFCRHNW